MPTHRERRATNRFLKSFITLNEEDQKIFKIITGRDASSLTVEEVGNDKELYSLIHNIRIKYSLQEDGSINYDDPKKNPYAVCFYSRYDN